MLTRNKNNANGEQITLCFSANSLNKGLESNCEKGLTEPLGIVLKLKLFVIKQKNEHVPASNLEMGLMDALYIVTLAEIPASKP